MKPIGLNPIDPDHGDPDHGDPDHGDPDHGDPDHGDPDHGPSRIKPTHLRPTHIGLGWLALGLLNLSCVDTELSLAVTVESAEVEVRSDTDGDVAALELSVHVRVGEHALAGDDFILPNASVFDGDAVVVTVNLMRPADFMGRLEPGESAMLTIVGESQPGAFPSARDSLCTSDDLRVLLNWQADAQPDDPLDPPIMSVGTAMTTTVSAHCP